MMRCYPAAHRGRNIDSLWLGVCFLAIAWQLAAGQSRAQDVDRSRKATTSRQANQEAKRAMPLDQLQAEDRKAVEFVLKNTSLYRRLPTQVIDCDPNLYAYLLENPEVLTGIWKTLQISQVTLNRTGHREFVTDDGTGTVGNIKMLHAGHDTHLVYAEGSYTGPLVSRPVNAKCVLLLRSRCLRETNDRYYITCRLDTFTHLDRVGVEWVAKTLQPLIGKAADYNFTETMAFVSSLSRTAEVNPKGLTRLVNRLEVEPEVRDRMLDITQQIAKRPTRTAVKPVSMSKHRY